MKKLKPMKKLFTDEWIRKADGAKMRIEVVRVEKGIRSLMFINGELTMDTFSKRPYTLGQSCDGTIDNCVHALFIDFCRQLDLDPEEIYYEAYPEAKKESSYDLENQTNTTDKANKEGVEYPKVWNKQAYLGLLESLTEINNHSLVSVIEDKKLF